MRPFALQDLLFKISELRTHLMRARGKQKRAHGGPFRFRGFQKGGEVEEVVLWRYLYYI